MKIRVDLDKHRKIWTKIFDTALYSFLAAGIFGGVFLGSYWFGSKANITENDKTLDKNVLAENISPMKIMLSGDHALLEGNVFEPSKPQISPFVELNGISLSKPDVSYSYLDKVNEEIAESSHAHVSKLIVEEDHVTPFISVSSPKPTVNRITDLSTENVENVSQSKLDNSPKPIFVGTNTVRNGQRREFTSNANVFKNYYKKLECQIADALNDKSTKTTTPTKDSLNPIALESVRTKDSLNPIALQPAPTKDSLNPIALQPATKDSLDPISQMKMNRGYSYLNPIRFVIAVLVGIVLKVNESFIKAMLGKKDHRDVDLPDLVDEPLTSRN
ncbi:hypothetical protein ROZALSC1DRAFT_25196, partial [Rozella allomycis CSF55]